MTKKRFFWSEADEQRSNESSMPDIDDINEGMKSKLDTPIKHNQITY